jgi:hypothetical protein
MDAKVLFWFSKAYLVACLPLCLRSLMTRVEINPTGENTLPEENSTGNFCFGGEIMLISLDKISINLNTV